MAFGIIGKLAQRLGLIETDECRYYIDLHKAEDRGY